MQVIEFHDPTGETMVARVPSQGTSAIRLGSQLIVEESQQAVFFRDGKALDTFGPGRHTLATQNVPILASIFGLPFGGESPFQSAVVFVSTKTFLDLKWGTKEPVIFRDHELAMVRLRAFGKFAVRVTNAGAPLVYANAIVACRAGSGSHNTILRTCAPPRPSSPPQPRNTGYERSGGAKPSMRAWASPGAVPTCTVSRNNNGSTDPSRAL
jgi:hypothetical protein